MNVVLVEPQIPQNTGNIARLCAATGSTLHLAGKLGFKTDDKHLKRAGLDYWKLLDIVYYDSFDDFEKKNCINERVHLMTTKANSFYSDISYNEGDYLVFGSETCGLSDEIRSKYKSSCVRIPMRPESRSLNLANSVGIVLYEALRQNGFASCQPSP